MARLVVVQKDGPNVEYESSLLDCTRVCPADLFDAISEIVTSSREDGFPQQEAPSRDVPDTHHKPLSNEELEHLIWATDHPVRTALCELRAIREGNADSNSGAD